jgi:uncharacterized protein (TIGR02246 family)
MTPTTKASGQLEDAIRHQVDEFVKAWNQHDPKAMSNVYAEDADMIDPNGRVAKNKKEIENLLREEHATSFKDSHMQLRPAGIRLLSPEVAVGDYEFEVTGARDQAGRTTTLHGHLTDIFKKQNGAWMVAASRPMIPAQALGQR